MQLSGHLCQLPPSPAAVPQLGDSHATAMKLRCVGCRRWRVTAPKAARKPEMCRHHFCNTSLARASIFLLGERQGDAVRHECCITTAKSAIEGSRLPISKRILTASAPRQRCSACATAVPLNRAQQRAAAENSAGTNCVGNAVLFSNRRLVVIGSRNPALRFSRETPSQEGSFRESLSSSQLRRSHTTCSRLSQFQLRDMLDLLGGVASRW
jgi:hypothetical protein